MENYEKEKMERLEKFERLVKRTIESVRYAILWSWAILGILIPVLAWYYPAPQSGLIQGCVMAFIFWILFAMAHGLAAIKRLED